METVVYPAFSDHGNFTEIAVSEEPAGPESGFSYTLMG